MEEDTFELKIDFERGTTNPARVFRSMTALIDATNYLDSDLVSSFEVKIRTGLVLQDIEVGSLRSILCNALKAINGDALKSGDWKKMVGTYLNRGRLKLIETLEEKPNVESKEQLVTLQKDLHALAESSDIAAIPHYQPIELPKLLKDIQSFRIGMAYLGEKDSAYYFVEGQNHSIPKKIEISPELRNEVLIKESITNSTEAIIKIKKPDYIGESMWQFRFSDHVIEAKIHHETWLADFQSRKIEAHPGDSLRVILETTVDYGYGGEVVGTHYRVTKVFHVIDGGRTNQLEF